MNLGSWGRGEKGGARRCDRGRHRRRATAPTRRTFAPHSQKHPLFLLPATAKKRPHRYHCQHNYHHCRRHWEHHACVHLRARRLESRRLSSPTGHTRNAQPRETSPHGDRRRLPLSYTFIQPRPFESRTNNKHTTHHIIDRCIPISPSVCFHSIRSKSSSGPHHRNKSHHPGPHPCVEPERQMDLVGEPTRPRSSVC